MNAQTEIVAAEPVESRAIAVPTLASESAAIISMIERAARDPSVDIEKFERLMAMRERTDREIARRSFNAAMAAAQHEMPQVIRRAENAQTKSVYAPLEAVGAAIDPVITAHGFSQSFGTADGAPAGSIRVTCLLAHSGGFEREYQADVPSDIAGIAGTKNKTPTHAFGSTISYGRRYLTMMIFNVKSRKALPDDDGNAASGGAPIEYDHDAHIPIDADDVAYVRKLLKDTERTETGLLARIKATEAKSVDNLTAAQFKRSVELLERIKNNGAAK